MKTKRSLLLLVLLGILFSAQKRPAKVDYYTYGKKNNTSEINLRLEKGRHHNHPLYAIWLADTTGKYIETLYVSESIGKGVFKRGSRRTGRWMSGEIERPASLPYWTHQRNETNEKGTLMPTTRYPVADTYTGATPNNSFMMTLFTGEKLNGRYRVYLELNQSWDWNEYWTNNKFPGDKEYMSSSQPALVYMAVIDTEKSEEEIALTPVGHSHYAGENGALYTDLKSITTALKIAERITVSVK